jgi:hypothetical protein
MLLSHSFWYKYVISALAEIMHLLIYTALSLVDPTGLPPFVLVVGEAVSLFKCNGGGEMDVVGELTGA